MSRRGSLPIFFAVSLVVLACAPFVGARGVALSAIVHPQAGDPAAVIFWSIRLPRVCLAWAAGAGLAVAGMVFQAMFRNALATPFTLGVSSGASLGAALGVRLGLAATVVGLSALTVGALIGAQAAIGVVYGLTRLKRDCSTGAMLLAGVAVNIFFSSLMLLVQYTADFYDTFRILRWLMGGLQTTGFGAALHVLAVTGAGAGVAYAFAAELNLLTIGEDLAAGRGVSVSRVKHALFLLVSLMVGTIVSVCGPVGFVGLVCPHICRLMVGPDHRRLVPAVVLFGGTFLVTCDTAARTVFAPTDLPVGIVTALLGAPFFLWLLVTRRTGESLPA
jgi:iron complex transport system permease protein